MPLSSPTPGNTTTIASSLSQTPSMEEVWNDIKLSSLSDYSFNLNAFSSPSSTSTSHYALRSFVLHEFLSSHSPATRLANSSTLDSALPASLHRHHHQPSLLTLNSASDSHKHAQDSSFDALDSSAFGPNKKARCDISHPTDRRHKRMIKNRESAARSRARRQESLCHAYKNELEIELATLREENARLRKQQEQPCLMPLDQHPKKRTLLRTSTAPF